MGGDYFSRQRPRLFGHRGAAGVAPENTLASFRRALRDGAEYLELDVHASREGVVVVIHDATLDRTTDGMGAVRDFTLEEIRRHDAGYRFVTAGGSYPYRRRAVRVPALREVLEELPGVPLNIEIKQSEPPIENTVVRLLRDFAAVDQVMLAAEDDQIMKRIRAAAPDAATSFSAPEVTEFFQRFFADELSDYRPPGRALQIPARFGETELVTSETLGAAHRLGIEMHVWTINDRTEMDRLLALGVDGLMSDLPAILQEAAIELAAESSRDSGSHSAAGKAPKQSIAELRKHPRSALGTKGRLRFADGREISAVFVDVSFGGTYAEITATEPVAFVGKDVSVEIPSLIERSQGRLGRLMGKVLWAKPAASGRIALGLRFSSQSTAKLKVVLSAFRYDEPE